MTQGVGRVETTAAAIHTEFTTLIREPFRGDSLGKTAEGVWQEHADASLSCSTVARQRPRKKEDSGAKDTGPLLLPWPRIDLAFLHTELNLPC